MSQNLYATDTGSIPAKGVGYLTLYDAAALRSGTEELLRRGAVTIYASGHISEGRQDGLELVHAYDLMRLSRPLRNLEPPAGKLTLKPLTRSEGAVFLSIYNESIITVPGRPTQSISDLSWLISEDWKTGIAWLDSAPVGVYECKCVDSTPEISALSILEHWRGKGLGRDLLRQTLAMLEQNGSDRCTTRIATNSSLFPLLRAEGFRAEELLSSWYEIHIIPESNH